MSRWTATHDAVVWKLDGLSDADLRRPMTPSGTTLLGLVKHLASVEYGWSCTTFGRATEPLPFDENDPDADPCHLGHREWAPWASLLPH